MKALQGTGVSNGIAAGVLIYYRRAEKKQAVEYCDDFSSELAKWHKAAKNACEQLSELAEKTRAEIGDEAAELFETHQLMLEDLDYMDRINQLISEEHMTAYCAVLQTGKEFANMFSAMDDEYMRARSADVIDISDRVASILGGETDKMSIGDEPVIIAADDLSPSETAQLDKSRIQGFILRGGSANSHTAILARTLGIPAIIKVAGDFSEEDEGRKVIIDGSIGYIVIDPDKSTEDYLERKRKEERSVRSMLEQLKGKPDVTLDGKEIKVYANITTSADVDAVITNDAQGVGLFRSEFLYLERNDFPSEDVQFEAYKSVVQRMNGKRVIIRTLDIGADKKLEYLKLCDEENPALGMRALRICLTRPEVFTAQLRALYRASAYGKLAIMFPMVTSVWEVQEAKRICSAVRADLKKERIPFDEGLEIGVMIETPAAVMVADELAKEASFFSIGTNDLTQYTLAVDRQSVAGLDKFYDFHHPAVMRMIKMTVQSAHKAGIWAGICGELAADLTLTEQFLKMGVDELSVSPRSILPVRNAVRGADLSK